MDTVEERTSVVLENQGQKIFGVLHLPVKQMRQVPAVLIFHGFGGNKMGANRMYVSQAQKLTSIGIAAFRFDFRGCGDSEGDLTETTLESEISDALKSIDFLKTHPLIDGSRLGILGVSLGGAVSVLAAEKSRSIKSLGLWAPVASGRLWQEEWLRQHPGLKIEPQLGEEICYKGKRISRDFLQQFISLHLDQTVRELSHVPFLHIHGEQDTTVSLNHFHCFENWRKQAASQNRFIRLPLSDHRFSDLDEQKLMLEETLHWFKTTL